MSRHTYLQVPLVIFPIALVFVAVYALSSDDYRELIAAPFSALVITAVGYPLAVITISVFSRAAQSAIGRPLAILAGVVIAEAEFWLLIHPFWQRDFSNLFCFLLVAAIGVTIAALLIQRKT